MKKLILSMAVVAMLFSCSKDNVETETTADLSATIAQSSAIEFSGVFGHHLDNDMHGKIYVTIDGSASQASIQLVNGEEINFQGNQLNKEATTVNFSSNRGSFTFDAGAEYGTRVSNLIFDDVSDAYVRAIEVPTRGGGMILLGTYEQDSDPSFNGNWNMLGDGIDIEKFGSNAQLVAMTVITHQSGFVVSDASAEDQVGGCTGGPDTFLWDPAGDVPTGGNPSVFSHLQTTLIAGIQANWGLEYRRDLGEQTYVDELCTVTVESGFWSWNGRTGNILASEPAPAPFTDGDANRVDVNKPLTLN